MVCYTLDFLAVPLHFGLLPFVFLGSPPTLWVVTLWISMQSSYLIVCYTLNILLVSLPYGLLQFTA